MRLDCTHSDTHAPTVCVCVCVCLCVCVCCVCVCVVCVCVFTIVINIIDLCFTEAKLQGGFQCNICDM